jgi:hypothetical protein
MLQPISFTEGNARNVNILWKINEGVITDHNSV